VDASYNVYLYPNDVGDVVYDAWDLATYGPPSWYDPNYNTNTWVDEFKLEPVSNYNDISIEFKNLVITSQMVTIRAISTSTAYSITSVRMKNCYINSPRT
jgi:hypothetical protein